LIFNYPISLKAHNSLKITANKPYRLSEQYKNEWNELEERVQIIKARGKFITSQEIVIYIKLRYGKGQSRGTEI